jgi:hypothetical protein
MSDTRETRQGTSAAAREPYEARRRRKPTAWAGFVLFAGTMLLVMGAIGATEGFVALLKDDYYAVTRSGLLVTADYTAWGWAHLIVGVIAVAAGFGVMAGQLWARVLGIGIAVVSTFVNFVFMSAFPVWSIIVIATDVLVIYALVVHGREVKTSS